MGKRRAQIKLHRKGILLKITHKLILKLIYFIFLSGFFSALFMVFWVYRPDTKIIAPLWLQAKSLPFEEMVIRRLYALEAWIVFGFASIFWVIQNSKKQ